MPGGGPPIPYAQHRCPQAPCSAISPVGRSYNPSPPATAPSLTQLAISGRRLPVFVLHSSTAPGAKPPFHNATRVGHSGRQKASLHRPGLYLELNQLFSHGVALLGHVFFHRSSVPKKTGAAIHSYGSSLDLICRII
jgi:hypothetical protein